MTKSKTEPLRQEAARLAALRECAILDTDAEDIFDDIPRLASYICQTPIAIISLVDATRQWFKAKVGLEATGTPRDFSFCAHAILKPELFVVNDTQLDARFVANPLVTSEPHIRFYAGAPLITSDGHALGTLCVIDREPRQLSLEQQEALRALARQTVTQLELRRQANTLVKLNRKLDEEIVERQQAERAREETRARAEVNEMHYRFLAESIPQQVWTALPDGTLDYVNQRTIDYFSRPEKEVIGVNWQEVIHPDDLPVCLERWQHARRTGAVYEVEFRLRRGSDEAYRWHLGRALPLRGADGEIVKWFGTNTDIDEQKLLYRLAEEANRTKDAFLATVSHELRTPLTSMMGWAELLKLGMLDEKGKAHAVDVIEVSARAQAQLIGDLLDISRIISGKLRLDVQPTELQPIIEAAMDIVHPAAEAKSLQLSTRFGRNVGMVSGDPDRLQQVVWNLLANAVKFTPEGGRVEVTLRRLKAQVEIIVADSGAGIVPEFLPRVFERFQQADGTSTRAHGGLGLGLAIVRHLIELHGGTVVAESAGAGCGAPLREEVGVEQSHSSLKSGIAQPTSRHPASLIPHPTPCRSGLFPAR